MARLFGIDEAPRYVRESTGSQLDPFAEAIAAILDADPATSASTCESSCTGVVPARRDRAGRLVAYRGVGAGGPWCYRLRGETERCAAAASAAETAQVSAGHSCSGGTGVDSRWRPLREAQPHLVETDTAPINDMF